MNRWIHSVFGLSLAGLLVLLATHGPALIGVTGDAWALLLRVVAEAPAGLWSFGLALALAVVAQPWLRGALPVMRCELSREFLIESAALAIGFGVMWLQKPTLTGALLGGLAGLAAPYVQKGLTAVFRLSQRAALWAHQERSK
jgi:hypothetical protein